MSRVAFWGLVVLALGLAIPFPWVIAAEAVPVLIGAWRIGALYGGD